MSGFSWYSASPAERGAMVRRHASGRHPLPEAKLMELFELSADELDSVLRGGSVRDRSIPER